MLAFGLLVRRLLKAWIELFFGGYEEGYILSEVFKAGPMVSPKSAQRQERMLSAICK